MVRHVRIKKFCELTGYTDDAVRAKISGGKWLEGTVWVKAPDGAILIDLEGYESWVEGREYAPLANKPSRSTSAGRGSDAANVYDLRRRRETSSLPQD